jgi:hypothetical protein
VEGCRARRVTTTGGGSVSLGAECESDADCGADGQCIRASDNDVILYGGAAGGYCTKPCASDPECPGPNSVCLLSPDGQGECFLGCNFGEPP